MHPERRVEGYRKPPSARQQEQARRARAKPWLFIDTEGANDPDGVYGDPGRQYTFTITAADDRGGEWSLFRGRPLTTKEMLEFILELPKGCRYGGFFFGYDRDQILCDVDEAKLASIYGTAGASGVPTYVGDIAVHVFASKFTVGLPLPIGSKPELDANYRGVRGPRREIWDVGKFYGARFSTVIENWQVASPAEQKEIEKMKGDRNDFSLQYWARNSERIINYSLLENRLAARLQTKFDQTCRDLGYPLTSWYGAGSMAKAMLKAHNVQEHLKNRTPIRAYKRESADFRRGIVRAYYGGRFEISSPGVHRPVYEYDIRSAYPASYRFLPCLQHGSWSYANSRSDRDELRPHDLYMVDLGKWNRG